MQWLLCILSNFVLAALLALAAWFVQYRLQRHSLARLLWILVLVKLVTPPLVSLPLGGSPGVAACSFGVCGCDHHPPLQSFLRDGLPLLLVVVWSIGAAAASCTVWCHWFVMNRLMKHGSPAPFRWQILAERLGTDLSLRRLPEIVVVPGRLPPLVVPGLFRSRLLIPNDLMGQLNLAEQKALILHELVHLKRGDHLVRILEMLVRVAFWWLPVVSLIGRQLRTCEEVSCDAAVIALLPEARRDYARLLLNVLEFVSPAPDEVGAYATAMSAAYDLELRLRAILEDQRHGQSSYRLTALALGLACAILPVGLRYHLDGASTDRSSAASAAHGTDGTGLSDENSESQRAALYCCHS